MKDLILAFGMTGFMMNAWWLVLMLRLRAWTNAYIHAIGILMNVPYIFWCWRYLWSE